MYSSIRFLGRERLTVPEKVNQSNGDAPVHSCKTAQEGLVTRKLSKHQQTHGIPFRRGHLAASSSAAPNWLPIVNRPAHRDESRSLPARVVTIVFIALST